MLSYQHQQQLRQQQQIQQHMAQQQQQMNGGMNGGGMNGGGMNGGGGIERNVTFYDLNNETGIKNRLPNLRYHVFISKETTKELSDYILPEPWGDENGLLYKYLDYVWRCQLFDRQIKKFYCRNEGKLVFHSGLQRRSDGEFVYLLLIRNDADSNKKVDQKWRVALGIQNGIHSRNMSFVTKQELLKHYWRYDESLLPKRTLFYSSEKDLIFNTNYRFEIDWEERLRTCKNRIYKTLSNDGNRKGSSSNIDESVLPIKELQRRFESETSKSISLSRANPRIGVPQAFIESKNGGYRLELLIPLTLYFSNRVYYFALALRPHHDEKIYEGMSILTREMAYANARLVGSIDSSWLTTRFATDNVGAAQHCSCTCHNFCNTGINPDHIHNLSDHKRKYNNDIPHEPNNNNHRNHHNNHHNKSKSLKINTKQSDHNNNNNNNNILSPSVTPRHSGHTTPNSHHNSYNNHSSHNKQPILNRTHSSDSNPYLNINNNNNNNKNNTQIRNHTINRFNNHRNNLNGMNTFPMRMNGMSPIQMNMYTPTANPYSSSLSMNSPNNALNTKNLTNKNGINTATTNPFSFVTTTTNTTPTIPNPYAAPRTAANINPYTTAAATAATNNNYGLGNLQSILTSAANPALNPAFITSVPNVNIPTVPNGTGAPIKTPLFTQNMSNASHTSNNPSPQRSNHQTNPLQINTQKPLSTTTATTTTPLTFLNSVGNTSLAAYGIPTLGPACLAGSSVVNMPIAQMSGPQSIGSSVPSSVPIYQLKQMNANNNNNNNNNNSINNININGNSNNNSNGNPNMPLQPQLKTTVSSTIHTMATNNIPQNNNNNKTNGNDNNNKNIKIDETEPNQDVKVNDDDDSKQDNQQSAENNKEGVKNTQTKIVKPSKEGQNIGPYPMEPIKIDDVEHKHEDNQGKQGFTPDMFADASPRTKEVFTGLTFDEVDDVYSLQPRNKSNKETQRNRDNGNNKRDRDNNNMPRAKSFHTNPNQHLPPLNFASHQNGGNRNQYQSRNNNNNSILSKTPTSHPTQSSWKSASFHSLHPHPSNSGGGNNAHSNTSSPSHGYNGGGTGRDTSPFHLRQINHTVRQHSHDGIHRTKSEHNMVMVNTSNTSKRYGGYNDQQQQQQHDEYNYYGSSQTHPATMLHSSQDAHSTQYNSSLYGSDLNDQFGLYGGDGNDKNAKIRMIKSHSQPSLADMTQMHVAHESFEQFQELNNNQSQQENQQNQQNEQPSPIQENHPYI